MQCVICDEPLPPRKRASGPLRIYCSDACKSRAARARNPHSAAGCTCARCVKRRSWQNAYQATDEWKAKRREPADVRERRLANGRRNARIYVERMTEIQWAAMLARHRRYDRERADARADEIAPGHGSSESGRRLRAL